jgi:glycine hydroxymethyltransferase
VIAGKATAFKTAAEPEFIERQQRGLNGAAIIAERRSRADTRKAGIAVVTGGTDVHLVMVDCETPPSAVGKRRTDSRLSGSRSTATRCHSIRGHRW